MNITDELREYAQSWRETPNLMNDLDAGDIDGLLGDIERIADCIDEAHESACAEAYGNGVESVALPDMTPYVKLPVDADGAPIHVGDVMECGGGTVFTVENISLHPFGWRCSGDGIDGNGYECTAHQMADCCRHHKPTIEDVFMEFAYKILNHDQIDAMSKRVKRYAEEYADKMHAIIEWSKGPEWQETASQDEGR